MSKATCCQDEDNLELEETSHSGDTITREYVCQECGRSHYRSAAAPKNVGMQGSDL